MAKKKNENTLKYLQVPLPSGGRYSKMTKVNFGGLNKRDTLDSGELSMEKNISTNEYPYLTPSMKPRDILNNYYNDDESKGQRRVPIDMFGFEDYLLVFYRQGNALWVDRISGNKENAPTIFTGRVKQFESDEEALLYDEEKTQRSIVQFNVYHQSIDIVNGVYKKHILIFPDKVSMIADFEDAITDPTTWTQDELKKKSQLVMYYYFDEEDREVYKYFTIETADDGTLFANRCGGVRSKWNNSEKDEGYFDLSGMSVELKEFENSVSEKDEEGKDIGFYPPPNTASHKYYYVNTHKFTKPDGSQYMDTNIYKWVDDEVDSNNSGWKISIPPTMPDIKYATVHVSRLFGVSDDCVYASGFNDYTNWALDTIDEYNESNAWQSKTQSNTKADGNFTGITNFQGHVVCFKRDFMHEIYNTKNPFRIQDVYAEGTIDNRTIQDVDGKLIFVSDDGVKIYTGSNPRVIDYKLNMKRYDYAVAGTDNRNYYLYCETHGSKSGCYLYVYDTYTEMWSEQSIDKTVINFTHSTDGMYMLCDDGCIYKLDSEQYSHEWSFETELITNRTVNIKHIKKLQMLVDVAANANLDVYILYDDEVFDKNSSHLVYSSTKHGKFPIRVKPRQTANYGFKLHIEGYGYVKIYELEMFVEAGGDMYV